MTVPIVVQLMIAPLRQVEIGTALAILRRHWWVFSLTSLVVIATILVGAALLIVPGAVVAVSYALYAPVAVMEGSGVWTTLKSGSEKSSERRTAIGFLPRTHDSGQKLRRSG